MSYHHYLKRLQPFEVHYALYGDFTGINIHNLIISIIDFVRKDLCETIMINSQQMLEDRKNIYLIGMMGSGKSTVGKMVASKTNMHFLDSDKIIEENDGKSVSEIFSNYGENKFRELERDFIRNGHPKNNCIVSCGGYA